MEHDFKILQFPVAPRKFDLFTAGNMVHVARLSRMGDVFRRGLLSVSELIKERGGGMGSQSFESKYVVFWKFEQSGSGQNIVDLISHIQNEIDDFETEWPIGYIVRNDAAVRLADTGSYWGLPERVSPLDFRALVVPMSPLGLVDGNHLSNWENMAALNEVRKQIAIHRHRVNPKLIICNHFGTIM